MDAFLSRKRSCPSTDIEVQTEDQPDDDDDSTETKLAMLASVCPDISTEALLEALLSCDGSVLKAQASLQPSDDHCHSPTKRPRTSRVPGYQSSLASFTGGLKAPKSPRKLTKKGKTLYLYSPEDIAAHTPCSIIHNFLPAATADALLRELLERAPTFNRDSFQLFEREVTSPHTFAFYVNDQTSVHKQQTEYYYNGSTVSDVRQAPPEMLRAGALVKAAVNGEIRSRIRTHYPGGTKLRYQSPREWDPNTSFVNCYDGARESVGYHADQLSYLGPRAVIGSLSLGVAREFRVRRIVPRAIDTAADAAGADAQGQISIHLPHNSLLVMHAEMQEEWKHSIAPAQAIEPHPIAGNKRLNVTYRWYREAFCPKWTPKCRCGVPAILRCVQRQEATRGRYMWMCEVSYSPGKTGCSFFQWAEFDDDGEPPWAHKISETT